MRQFFGAGILIFFILYLFLQGNIYAWSHHMLVLTVLMVLMVFSMIAMGVVLVKIDNKKASYPIKSKAAAIDFLSVFSGAILTFLLTVYFEVNVVLASGLIGTMAVLFMKPYQVALFCGSFLGMSSPEIFDLLPFVLASALASLIYVIAKDVFNGFGGKLGTIAFSGVFISTIIHGKAHLEGPVFTLEEGLMIIVVAVFGAVVSNMLNIRFAQGATFGSAFVGVIAGGLLPYLFASSGLMLAVVMFGASFVGMSNQKVLKNEYVVGVTGIVFGVLFIYTSHALGGLGGKLGTLALASVLSIYGMNVFYNFMFKGDESHA